MVFLEGGDVLEVDAQPAAEADGRKVARADEPPDRFGMEVPATLQRYDVQEFRGSIHFFVGLCGTVPVASLHSLRT